MKSVGIARLCSDFLSPYNFKIEAIKLEIMLWLLLNTLADSLHRIVQFIGRDGEVSSNLRFVYNQ